MSKESIKKLTLSDFIARKEQRERDRKSPQTDDLYIKSLGGYITVAEPTAAQIADARKMAGDSEEYGNAYIVYQCCVEPSLKSAELQCGEPRDTVLSIFKPGEVQTIAGHLMKMAGYDDDSVTVADKLKN